MKIPIRIEKGDNSVDLHISWSLHNTCNYRCSYCPSYNQDASQKWLTQGHIVKFIDAVHDYYVTRMGFHKIQVSFTGGEPTLWKGFKDACRYIADKGMTLGVTSNCSMTADYWDEFACLFDWICLSYHPAYVNDQNFYDVVRIMHDRPDTAVPALRFMMLPENKYWDQCVAFADRIKSTMDNWAVEFVKIQNDFGIDIVPVKYTREQTEFMRERGYEEHHGRPGLVRPTPYTWDLRVVYNTGEKEKLMTNDLVNRDLASFVNWRCNIGLELLCVDYYGSVTRSGCQQGGEIGRLNLTDALVFPSEPVICRKQRCNCGTEIMVSKSRDGG